MTDRIPLDELTSDAYDALHADLDWARRQALAAQQEATEAVTRAERAEAAIRDAAPTLQRALDCLAATCRYHGDRLDPDEHGRRYRAEACCDTGIEPRRAREATAALNRLRAALDEHQEQPGPGEQQP